MDTTRTPRAFPLITATLISYAIANAVAMNGAPTADPAAQAPTAYSDDHARIVGDPAEQPPTF